METRAGRGRALKNDKIGNTLALGRVRVSLGFVVCTLSPCKKMDGSCMPRVEFAGQRQCPRSKANQGFRPFYMTLTNASRSGGNGLVTRSGSVVRGSWSAIKASSCACACARDGGRGGTICQPTIRADERIKSRFLGIGDRLDVGYLRPEPCLLDSYPTLSLSSSRRSLISSQLWLLPRL